MELPIDWIEVLKKIDYKFDSLGATSILTIEDDTYGELTFMWTGNKKSIDVSFVHTSVNCICSNPTIVSCDCDWIAFQEGPTHPQKSFSKKRVYKLIDKS